MSAKLAATAEAPDTDIRYNRICAGVAKSANAADLKSGASRTIRSHYVPFCI